LLAVAAYRLRGTIAEEPGDFSSAIRTGSPPQSDVVLGLEVVRTIDAAEQAWSRGQEVTLVDTEERTTS
jgi:hypothetical protein